MSTNANEVSNNTSKSNYNDGKSLSGICPQFFNTLSVSMVKEQLKKYATLWLRNEEAMQVYQEEEDQNIPHYIHQFGHQTIANQLLNTVTLSLFIELDETDKNFFIAIMTSASMSENLSAETKIKLEKMKEYLNREPDQPNTTIEDTKPNTTIEDTKWCIIL